MITHVQSTDIGLYRFSSQIRFTAASLSGWTWIAAVWSSDYRLSIEKETRRYSFRLHKPCVHIVSSTGQLEVVGKGSGFLIELRNDVFSRLLFSEFVKKVKNKLCTLPKEEDPPQVFEKEKAETIDECTLFEVISRIEQILHSTKTTDTALREVYLLEFLIKLTEWQKKETGDILMSSNYSSTWSVKDVASFIKTNYDQQHSLDELAERCGLNPAYLSKAFHDETGIPLFEYINQLRVKKACELLKHTSGTVTEIAFDVGYNNITFFNRYFKRITGMTPREYRR